MKKSLAFTYLILFLLLFSWIVACSPQEPSPKIEKLNDVQKETLNAVKQITLQMLVISAGVFAIIGGFVTASQKSFSYGTWPLKISLIFFALSILFGYLVFSAIIGTLDKGVYDPFHILIRILSILQIGTILVGGVSFIKFLHNNL